MKKIAILILFAFLICGCAKEKNEVVIYTSLDQLFSEPILKDFQRETSIKVKAIYDVEAAKTTGLVNRLIAERNYPRCDVFWNSEIGRTIILKNKGILTPYISPSSKDIPAQFKDKENYWVGFASRARVLVYNKDLVSLEQVPQSIFELTQSQWQGQVALANPLFGTTSIHCASLFVKLGDDKASQYFQELKENKAMIVDGNSTSRDRVVSGMLKIGFTDTDDVNVALEEGKNIAMIFPDKDGIGTLLIPNTVCLIKNGPNPENGRRLIDYLLSKEVENKLAFSGSLQIPVRADVLRPDNCPKLDEFKWMQVDYEVLADEMERVGKILKKILLQ